MSKYKKSVLHNIEGRGICNASESETLSGFVIIYTFKEMIKIKIEFLPLIASISTNNPVEAPNRLFPLQYPCRQNFPCTHRLRVVHRRW